MPTARVIDLSHHNSVPKDFMEAKAAGIIGVVHKLTEGTSYVDDKCQARHYLAKEAGMLWGLYHFMRPGNIEKQAKYFWDTANYLAVIDNNTMLCADHEDQNVPAKDLKLFLDTLEDLSGRSPVVYSGHVLKDQLKGQGYRPTRRLWLCQYTTGTPSLPEGVDHYWLWQYSDSGTVPGITPPTDVNHFDMEEEDFVASWSGQLVVPPEPIPPDEQELVTVTIDAPDGVTVKVVINGRTV